MLMANITLHGGSKYRITFSKYEVIHRQAKVKSEIRSVYESFTDNTVYRTWSSVTKFTVM